MEIRRKIIIFLMCFFLSGCSSNARMNKLQQVVEMYKNNNNQNPIIPITEEMISNINYPLIEVKTNGILIQTLMLPLSTRNNIINYTSGSGQLLTIEGSVISKTNGMNINLISLSLKNNNPLLSLTKVKNWTKDNFKKEYKFINTSYSIENVLVECIFKGFKKEPFYIFEEKEIILTKVIEFCKNENFSFENFYWVEDSGKVLSSRQWLNKDKTFASIKILK